MDIEIGGVALAMDGERIGVVRSVIIDLNSDEMTGLVVQADAHSDRFAVVDVDDVERAEEDHVILGMTSEEFARLPDQVDLERLLPATRVPESRPAAPTEPAPLEEEVQMAAERLVTTKKTTPDFGQPVAVGPVVDCVDGLAGPLHRILVDEYTNSVTHVVVGKASTRPKEVMVPYEWVTDIDEHGLTLNCPLRVLESMPPAPLNLEL